MNNEIVSYTSIVLALLVDLYEKGRMSYKQFTEHASLKISFLEESLRNLEACPETEYVNQIIRKSKDIILVDCCQCFEKCHKSHLFYDSQQ